jgi:hypothetical protein
MLKSFLIYQSLLAKQFRKMQRKYGLVPLQQLLWQQPTKHTPSGAAVAVAAGAGKQSLHFFIFYFLFLR